MRAIILLYHRVAELKSDHHMLGVSPANFDKQMKFIKENYNVCSLSKLVECIKIRKLPPKSVVITFDDGYADNHYHAYPILQKYNIPATIFITTSMIDSDEEFWWDRLEYLLLSKGKPGILRLEINGRKCTYNTINNSERLKVYNELHKIIKQMSASERDVILNKISEWASAGNKYRREYRALNQEEIKNLVSCGLIEIGAHTHTHPQLSALSKENQLHEIKTSKEIIESIINKQVLSFSYPFGTKSDYTSYTVKICKEIGFEICCSNFQGQVRPWSDNFQLPRFIVRNWDIKTFKRKINLFWTRNEK